MERLQNEGRLPPTRRYGTNNSKSGQSSRRGMSFDNVWARSDDEAGPSSAASSFSTTATTRKAKTGAQKERSEAKSKGKTTKRDEDDEIDNFPASKNNARKTSKERSKLASGSRRTGSASKELGLADIYEGLGGSSKRRKTGEDSPTSPKAKTPLRGLKLPGRFEPSISENRIESCDLALASSSSDKETNTPDVSSLMPRSKSSRARALIVPKKRSDPGSGSKTQTQKSSGEAFADSLLTTLALGSSQGSEATASCSQPSSSQPEPIARDAKDLKKCPFCGEAMPTDPSATLLRMMQRWLSAFHEGRSIGSTDTLAVCHKHRDEHSVIPSGRAKGWPTALDHGALRARVREGRYWATMQDRVLEPGSSEWFVAAKKQREELGKKADAGMMQMTSFAEEQAGYYGEQGWELLSGLLATHFIRDSLLPSFDLSTSKLIAPLNAFSFISRVLMPELVCMLIQDDLGGPDKVSLDEAKKVKEESAKYGVAMFPSAGENSGGIEGATPARHSRLASEAKRDDTSGGIEADSKVKSPTISATSKPKRALKLPARGSRSKASEASKGTAPILASTSSSSTLRRSDGREPTDSLSPPTSLDDDNKDDDKGKEGGWQSNMWDDSVEPPSSSLVDGEMDLEA